MEIIDFDSHVLEPEAIWLEYLEPEYRTLARSTFWHEQDEFGSLTVLNGRVVAEQPNGWLQRAAAWRPGLGEQDIAAMDFRTGTTTSNPGASDPRIRLDDLDAMGINRQVLLPTLFGEYFPLIENPDVAWALARAYNDWVKAFAAVAPDRFIPAAVLPVQAVTYAVRELKRVVKAGFRVVVLRPAFFQGKYITAPEYDGLWEAIEEAGVVAAVHAYPGSNNPEFTSHGPYIERVAAKASHGLVGFPIAEVIAPWMDNATFLAAQFYSVFFARFPRIRIVMLHSGASWLPFMLQRTEGYLMIGSLPSDTEEIFHGHGVAMLGCSADERMLQMMPERFKGVAVWESHYPNHDTVPANLAQETLRGAGIDDETVAAIFGENGRRLLEGSSTTAPATTA
jgi:predicted TIM-barrel fold metal-dependent hydrolase